VTYVDSTDVVSGQLGFIQPIFYERVPENTRTNTLISDLDVVNQGESKVFCTIIAGNEDEFSMDPVQYNKNCKLILRGDLDYEKKTSYNLTVRVERSSNRRKRQTNLQRGNVHNAWNPARVIIQVIDINDNPPVWQIPRYINNDRETQNKYFAVIEQFTRPERKVLTILATDADSGNYGQVRYLRGVEDKDYPMASPPFKLNDQNGEILTTREITYDNFPTYRFEVVAQDNPGQTRDQNSVNAEVVVHVAQDYHRFVATFKGVPEEYTDKLEAFRLQIQDFIGFNCLIERVEYKRELTGPNEVSTNTAGTDIIFVLSDQDNQPNFPLINNTNERVARLFDSTLGVAILSSMGDILEDVHLPYAGSDVVKMMLTKSYIWFSDEPWTPLIAIVGISILLAVAGILVIIFTHSR